MTDYAKLENRQVQHPLWPETVRILCIQKLGRQFEVSAKGLSSQRFQKRLLTSDELGRNLATTSTNFAGDPDLFALGVEARRIKLGHTFDPHFAISTSKIDPLPHQLERARDDQHLGLTQHISLTLPKVRRQERPKVAARQPKRGRL